MSCHQLLEQNRDSPRKRPNWPPLGPPQADFRRCHVIHSGPAHESVAGQRLVMADHVTEVGAFGTNGNSMLRLLSGTPGGDALAGHCR